jgi:hypothetical protein
MLAFVGSPPNEDSQVNHKDENPYNNCLDNLEYVSPQENSNYGDRINRAINTRKENADKIIYCSRDELGLNVIKEYKKAKMVIQDGYNYDAVLRASLGKYQQGTHKYRNVY